MKKQQNSKSNADISIKNKAFPKCINKKQARMVCLNECCQVYAFFCTQCDDQTCENEHRHQDKGDKLMAIGFKQFIRRVLRQRKPIQQLETAINNYKETLQKLRKDVNEFVDKELKNLTQIIEKATQVPQDLLPTIKKLRQQNYLGLLGTQMDYLWKNCGQSLEIKNAQLETTDFIKIKNEQIKAISQHFQNLNTIQMQKHQTQNKPKAQPTNKQYKK